MDDNGSNNFIEICRQWSFPHKLKEFSLLFVYWMTEFENIIDLVTNGLTG
jgi:hypothetical protein